MYEIESINFNHADKSQLQFHFNSRVDREHNPDAIP